MLAVQNLKEAQKGALFCACMKILGFLYLALPDVIAYALFELQGTQVSTMDDAYPQLITQVVPAPLMGFFAAVMFGAIISSFNSVLNSVNTMFTMDIYHEFINILIFDNCGFGCINNLEMNHGIGSLATEFRYTDGKKPTGDLIPMDYAKIGEGYGLKSYTCRTIAELEAALEDAKKQTVACLFDLKVIPKTMTDGYESWWNVGLADVSEKESVREAWKGVKEGRDEARKY